MFCKWHHLFLHGCDPHCSSFGLAAKKVISGSLKCFLVDSPGSQRLSVCGSARLIGLGGWFPSPAWQLSGCVLLFSSFPPSQSAHSPGWSSPAVRRTSRLWEYYPGCLIPLFHSSDNHILGCDIPICSLTSCCSVKVAILVFFSSFFSDTVME